MNDKKNLYKKNGNILYILNTLKRYTDINHLLTTNEIKLKIKKDYEVDIDPRTIRRNINLLIEVFNYDIETYQDNHRGYRIIRDAFFEFELGELETIIQTFAYSSFVSKEITDSVINKCLSMMSIYEQENYKNYQASIKNIKSDNKEIINNIEIINEAIKNKKKITFEYYKYFFNENNQLTTETIIPKIPYKLSPYKIFYGLQKLYLICLKDGMKELLIYRLDKIKNMKILKEKRNEKYSEQEIDYYVKNNVAMFTGEQEKVEIECNIILLDNVIETFGKDIKIKKINEEIFYASFYTVLSGFKYWCLRNIENVKILSPLKFKKEITKIIKESIK